MTKTLNYRNGLWIGTKEYMTFVPAPSRGVAANVEGYHEDATGKNGGGYVSQSRGRHKTLQYNWPVSTDRKYAAFVQGLRDGAYGRGVIHFTDPTCYETNVMPAHWANPGMTLGFEMPPLVFRSQPSVFQFGMSDRMNTPLNGATYNKLPTTFDVQDAFFVAIPPGMDFIFGSRYLADAATAGIYLQPVLRDLNGMGTRFRVPDGIDAQNPFQVLTTERVSGDEYGGVYVWIGRTGGSALTEVSILDMVGRLIPSTQTVDWGTQGQNEAWYIGEGHTGMAIVGQPTITYDGLQHTSISATFKEVGAWELASRL